MKGGGYCWLGELALLGRLRKTSRRNRRKPPRRPPVGNSKAWWKICSFPIRSTFIINLINSVCTSHSFSFNLNLLVINLVCVMKLYENNYLHWLKSTLILHWKLYCSMMYVLNEIILFFSYLIGFRKVRWLYQMDNYNNSDR